MLGLIRGSKGLRCTIGFRDFGVEGFGVWGLRGFGSRVLWPMQEIEVGIVSSTVGIVSSTVEASRTCPPIFVFS